MTQIANITFLAGSLAFVFIGVLHTWVHFKELSGEDLRAGFARIGPVPLQGKSVDPWKLFQGISLLMGFFSLAYGCALISVFFYATPAGQVPHPILCCVTIALLASIAVVGRLYLSAFQFIGGLVGILCFGLPLLAS
ncbi:MAG: hypothetical protein AAF393_03100 [Pseudomonadota bacterium]